MASTDTDLVEVPKYAHVYVDQVIGEYEAVRNAIPNLPVNELAQQIIDKYRSGTSLTWGEMYALEWLLVNFQSDEKRRALVPFLKARLAVLSGTGGQHLPAFDLAKSDSASVLAYVESLLREINRLLAVTACRERLRKRRQLRLVWFIGITVLLLLIVLAVVHHLDCRGVLWTMPVPLMGALGGFISSQRHVQSIASVGESLTD